MTNKDQSLSIGAHQGEEKIVFNLGRTLDAACRDRIHHHMETPLPKRWRGTYLDKYDGTTDLDEHLASYLTQVNLFSNEDVILCRIFPTSMKGSSLHWYT
ncbi:hypothetical protein CR513_13146, partial [Mucuna pruriens]